MSATATIRETCEVMDRLPAMALRELARRIDAERGNDGVSVNTLAEVIAGELEPAARPARLAPGSAEELDQGIAKMARALRPSVVSKT